MDWPHPQTTRMHCNCLCATMGGTDATSYVLYLAFRTAPNTFPLNDRSATNTETIQRTRPWSGHQ